MSTIPMVCPRDFTLRTKNGGHVIKFEAGKETDVPEEAYHEAISKNIVPVQRKDDEGPAFTLISNEITGTLPILYVREGERRDELLGLINEEPSISILVLAAGTGPEGPGPLVTHLAGKGVGKLRIPLTLVPGSLRREQLDLIT